MAARKCFSLRVLSKRVGKGTGSLLFNGERVIYSSNWIYSYPAAPSIASAAKWNANVNLGASYHSLTRNRAMYILGIFRLWCGEKSGWRCPWFPTRFTTICRSRDTRKKLWLLLRELSWWRLYRRQLYYLYKTRSMQQINSARPNAQITLLVSSSGPVLNRPNNSLPADPTAPLQHNAIGPSRRLFCQILAMKMMN